jgi:hypothetical protein
MKSILIVQFINSVVKRLTFSVLAANIPIIEMGDLIDFSNRAKSGWRNWYFVKIK